MIALPWITGVGLGLTPFLLSPIDAAFQGHDIHPKPPENTLLYRIRGSVFRRYLGGVKAKEVTSATLLGNFIVKPLGENEVEGFSKDLSLTEEGKPLPKGESILGWGGKWRVSYADGSWFYTFNGKPRIPHFLNLPLFPLAWAWTKNAEKLKVGTSIEVPFDFPVQTFLEDDPVGSIPVRFVYIFDGEDHTVPFPAFRFRIATNLDFDHLVQHPEAKGLSLRGRISVVGTLILERKTGIVEKSEVTWNGHLMLSGPEYPFGFSKAEFSSTVSFQREKT
ncbi:MAG TPA: hypothetical protein VNK96_06680 [Fimbriimonadales bacterium]|nr:hypothetical protein [Fimbriimonadales bacterium]